MVRQHHKKIVIYSHDTYGSGNIRRLLAIAQHLVTEYGELSILILSGSPMPQGFRLADGIDYIKLPCLRRDREGRYSAKRLRVEDAEMAKLRGNLILSTVLDFQPDLLLVDKKPLGVGNELVPTLEHLQRRHPKAKRVLLLRDTLDRPEITIPLWEKRGYFDVLESQYDQVLVAGSADICDVCQDYGFPEAVRSKVRFCGYIGPRPRVSQRDALRRQLGIGPAARLVLVALGACSESDSILTAYLQGLHATESPPEVQTIVACGPHVSADRRQALKVLAGRVAHCTVLETPDDVPAAYLDAADLVICRGSYNTLCELLAQQKRALVIPRVTPTEEQWRRSERLAKRGLLRIVHPAALSPGYLMQVVAEELAAYPRAPVPVAAVDLAGLVNITDAITGLLSNDGEGLGSASAHPERRLPH